jgi:acyl-CoA reductase-like NAD-dependent aldehyde dehydrogenase
MASAGAGAADITIERVGAAAREAAQAVAATPLATRNALLAAVKAALREHADAILAANAKDLAAAAEAGLEPAVAKVGGLWVWLGCGPLMRTRALCWCHVSHLATK